MMSVSVSEHVLNGYMAQMNLAVLISVPDQRQLIRNHVLEQTVKTDKGTVPTNQACQHWTEHGILYSHDNTTPQIPTR